MNTIKNWNDLNNPKEFAGKGNQKVVTFLIDCPTRNRMISRYYPIETKGQINPAQNESDIIICENPLYQIYFPIQHLEETK